MTDRGTKLLLAGVMTISFCSNLFAQTLAEQKICAEAAKVYFNEAHPVNPITKNDTFERTATYFAYETHFNTKLGRCLIQITILNQRNDKFVGQAITVEDVFERKMYEVVLGYDPNKDRTPEQERALKHMVLLMSE